MFEGVLAVSSSALTAFMCLNADELGRSLQVIDRPDARRKHHTMPTPLMGGLAVLLPFFLLVIAYSATVATMPLMGSILILAGGFTTLGYLDDRRNLDARLRLVAGILLIGAVIAHEPGHMIRDLEFGFASVSMGTAVAIGFTILVVLGLINAVNMADGMNGIVSGLGVIWTLCIAWYIPPVLQPLLFALALLLAVVLIFNLCGKLFLGDAGAYGLAALFSILTIYTYNQADALNATIVIAWFIVPVLDCVRLMISRAMKGRSPFSADRDHLHHRLQQFIPGNRVFLVYWGLIGIPSAGAMVATEWSLAFVLAVAVLYAVIILLTSQRVLNSLRTKMSKAGIARWRGEGMAGTGRGAISRQI